jgi:hypothetical protein
VPLEVACSWHVAMHDFVLNLATFSMLFNFYIMGTIKNVFKRISLALKRNKVEKDISHNTNRTFGI